MARLTRLGVAASWHPAVRTVSQGASASACARTRVCARVTCVWHVAW